MTEEGEIQKSVFEHLRKRGVPGVIFWHTPNDRKSRTKAGYRAGVSDVACLHKGKFYAIELKKAKGGVISEEQLEFVSDVNRAGGYAFIAEGLPQAIAGLEAWGLLRRAA